MPMENQGKSAKVSLQRLYNTSVNGYTLSSLPMHSEYNIFNTLAKNIIFKCVQNHINIGV